jgi:hypothetical protein
VPFDPFELGAAAMLALVGFTVAGPPAETEIEPEAVPLIGFTVAPASPVTRADLDEFKGRTRGPVTPSGRAVPRPGHRDLRARARDPPHAAAVRRLSLTER